MPASSGRAAGSTAGRLWVLRKGSKTLNAKNVSAAFADIAIESLSDEQFVEYFNASLPPGLVLMQAKCLSASRDRKEVVVSFDLDDQFTNVAAFIAGGYLAQALDQTATAAATLMTGMAAPSIDLKTSFIGPALPGRFTVTGWVVRAGKSIAFAEARLSDRVGRLVATASVTSQLLSPSSLVTKRGTQLPLV
jgi:uncharacterized protein (TIGR00369 family)